jgi:hypothetical protein
MKATLRRDDRTPARSDWGPQPSIDLSARSRERIREDRDSDLIWNVWYDVAFAGVVWLILLGLVLFALSAVARHQPAAPHSGRVGTEIVR